MAGVTVGRLFSFADHFEALILTRDELLATRDGRRALRAWEQGDDSASEEQDLRRLRQALDGDLEMLACDEKRPSAIRERAAVMPRATRRWPSATHCCERIRSGRAFPAV